MGRKSLAQLFYEEYEEREASREEGQWMVIYDFPQMKPQAGFWRNIHRLRVISGAGVLVQYSSFLTTDRNAALTMLRLVNTMMARSWCTSSGKRSNLVLWVSPPVPLRM